MLIDALLDAYRLHGKMLAVDDGLRALTYKDLTLLASVFRSVVLQKTECQRVGVMLPASAVFPPALFGIQWAGKVAVPLNFLLNPDELAGVVRDAQIDIILTIKHFKEHADALPARALYLEELPLKRQAVFASIKKFPPPPTVEPNDTAVILYTSGTTAEPKGVELTHENLKSNCSDSIVALDLQPGQRILNVLPPFHVFGLSANVLMPIILGATVYAIPRFSPLAMAKAVAAKKITMMMAIPSMYAAILKTKSTAADAFQSVRLAISGGEPLADSVRQGFLDRFGVTLLEGYGLTETSPVVSCCSAKTHRTSTVGQLLPSVKVRIVDADQRDVPVGGEGEILVNGPGVMKGYYRKPEETEKVIDSDGWFHTGDIGRLDEDGYLAITGRLKEMLIIGGENVFPREIEAVLEMHESVLQAAVIGVSDPMRGEIPVAFVIPQTGAEVTQSDLRQFAKQHLAGFKIPRRIDIREELPKGPTGKILKRRLAELL